MQSRRRNSMNALAYLQTLAVAALIAATAVGCSGGGGGNFSARPPGVPLEDLHGDTPGTATRIFPDGPAVSGAINHANDRDYFRYRGNKGILYSVTTHGFPAPQPDIAFFERQEDLEIRIIQPDGFTQLLNSAGTDSGDPYDIDPAGVDVQGDFITKADYRLFFFAPSNGTYFIQFRHERANGLGNYKFSLSSTEEDTTFAHFSDTIDTGRAFNLFDDDGNPIFAGILTGSFLDAAFEFEPKSPQNPGEPITDFDRGIFIAGSIPQVFFLDAGGMLEEEPETPVFHVHLGFGHLAPALSINITDGDEDHPFFLSFEFDKELASATSITTGKATVRGPEGNELETQADVTVTPRVAKDGSRAQEFVVQVEKQDPVDEDVFRTISGLEFYFDGHISTDEGLSNFAEADQIYAGSATVLWASPTWGGIANFFETDFILDAANVVPDPGFNPNPPIEIFYDSSLQMFQIAYQQYDPALIFDSPVNNFLQHDYVGQPLRIHRGGPGQVGPVILDLGPLPPNRQPPLVRTYDFTDPITDGPNVRIPIKQLTEDEVELLRNTFYTGGFYLQIATPNFPAGAVRAEGFLEIQLVPGDPMKDGPRAKGTVTFASDYAAGGDITVVCNGKILGTIDGSMESEVWGEYWPDDYYYRAFAEDGTEWDGIVTIPGYGSTETIILSIN